MTDALGNGVRDNIFPYSLSHKENERCGFDPRTIAVYWDEWQVWIF